LGENREGSRGQTDEEKLKRNLGKGLEQIIRRVGYEENFKNQKKRVERQGANHNPPRAPLGGKNKSPIEMKRGTGRSQGKLKGRVRKG